MMSANRRRAASMASGRLLTVATAEEIGLPQLPIVKAVRDVFKTLYDEGHERWDHSAFLLHLEKLNAPARLGNKADTPPA